MNLAELKRAYENGSLSKPTYIEAMHAAHKSLFEYADFIGWTDIARIEITAWRVVMTTQEGDVALVCDPNDRRIAPMEILNFGAYEPAEARLMLRLAKGARTIFDIGANVGYYAIRLARQNPEGAVFAFEPIPATFAYLGQNLALNRVSNVRAFSLGLSDREEMQAFYLSPHNSVNASAARLSADSETVTCHVTRLDDFVKAHHLTVDFIKCDVEGGEWRVFRGAAETLRRDRPIVMTEMLRKWSAKFAYHPNAIIDELSAIGYQCFAVQGDRAEPFFRMDDQTTATNFFFLHERNHRRQIEEWRSATRAA